MRLGARHSEETRDRMSVSHIGNSSHLGMKTPDDVKRKISDSMQGKQNSLGHKHSAETRSKMSRNMMGNKRLLGHHHSEETRKKIAAWRRSEEQLQRLSETHLGPKNSQWQGGIANDPYGPKFNQRLRNQIRERDGYTCKICGKPENGQKHDCHHVDYVKTNNNHENLITLCHGCHSLTCRNREQWKSYFRAATNG
jgi:hypothetical protein